MSTVRFVARDASGERSGMIDARVADQAIAALSADPESIAELEDALGRYAKGRPLSRLVKGPGSDSPGEDLVVIDLAARLVVDSDESSPQHTGAVSFHDGECCKDIALPYHLSDEWLFTHDTAGWGALADKRRAERKPPIDARAVLYGRPILEFLARRSFEVCTARKDWDEDTSHEAIKGIHAEWLMTPRGDLGGLCPREFVMQRRSHISWDMQDRCHQWSFAGSCPPGLPKTSHAYRYGGFGIHELVVHYYLVRELLSACWEQLERIPEGLTAGDFLATELPRLEKVRDDYLDAPDYEFSGHVPRSIIEHERARIPEGMSGADAMVDADCPCCQMLADMPGPMFWHLDGCNMDEGFAFNIYHKTREEWDEEQREFEEHSRKWEAEWEEKKRLGVDFGSQGNPVWKSSFVVADTADVPLGIRVFGIGCQLAEVIAELRKDESPAARLHIDGLNRHFGNLHGLLQSGDAELAAALVDPVIERFADSLADAGNEYPVLAARSESLRGRLDRLLDPPPKPESERFGEREDVPF